METCDVFPRPDVHIQTTKELRNEQIVSDVSVE